MVAAVEEYNKQQPVRDNDIDDVSSLSSLSNLVVGSGISHSQVLDIHRTLAVHSSDPGATEQHSYHLDDLLRGSHIYVEPPQPKPEPTQEYKDLMARLQRDEEERSYQAMLSSNSSNPFSPTVSKSPDPFADEDEMTFADVNRQLTLIINVLVSILACGISIWLVASHISTPARLALAMGGALIVAVAEVVIYAGYLRRLQEAKVKERGKKEKKTIMATWSISGTDEKTPSTVASGRNDDDSIGMRYRLGKRR